MGASPPNDQRDLLKKADEMLKASQYVLEGEDYWRAGVVRGQADRPHAPAPMFVQWAKGYAAMSKVVAPEPPPRRAAVRHGRQMSGPI